MITIGIDLTLLSKYRIPEYLAEDGLIQVLLDKNNLLLDIDSSSDSSYWINKPYQKIFDECINEFYWISTYVMKGIWRNELLYAIDHLNICRRMLFLMLAWDEGYKFNFQVNFGKSFKYLPNYLGSNKNSELTYTYPHLNINEISESLYIMIEMFDYATVRVGNKCKLNYDTGDYVEVKKYIGYKK